MIKVKDFETLGTYIRNFKLGKSEGLDYIEVDSVLYTLINYDLEGRELVYSSGGINSKYIDDNCEYFYINTSDRYKNGFKDAIINY